VINLRKKGALELSIGTIVIIVIGMSMLILGLVLVRTIFTGSTQSVESINEGVMKEITNLFKNEDGNLIIKLGTSNKATIKPGTDSFGVAFGVRDPDGNNIGDRSDINYKIDLSEDSDNNCIRKLGDRKAKELFITKLEAWHDIDSHDGSTGASVILMKVPKGTSQCSQKVNVDVRLKGSTENFAADFFILEVGREGIF
jgi:hypothetical protein